MTPGSTEFLAQALAGAGLTSLPAGGFDLTPTTLSAIQAGSLDFTINQNPYLQGFLPTLYLYMFNLSGGLVPPPDTDTGLSFITKSNVGPYLSTAKQVRGLHHRAEDHPAAVRADPEPDGHHEHLTRAPATERRQHGGGVQDPRIADVPRRRAGLAREQRMNETRLRKCGQLSAPRTLRGATAENGTMT